MIVIVNCIYFGNSCFCTSYLNISCCFFLPFHSFFLIFFLNLNPKPTAHPLTLPLNQIDFPIAPKQSEGEDHSKGPVMRCRFPGYCSTCLEQSQRGALEFVLADSCVSLYFRQPIQDRS